MSATTTERVLNFSAGPAVLPESVLETVRDEMMCLPGVGSSVMEISHRSPAFVEILNDARQRIIDLMNIPEEYDVFFVQGGATLQNAMIPANLMADSSQTADYLLTGTWGKKSSQDVSFYGKLNVAYDAADNRFKSTPTQSELNLSENAAYLHLTSNETIQGVQFFDVPETNAPIVTDQSSDFLSRPIDVSQYGLIYACAQKNCGIAGLTTIVIRKDLLERSIGRLPRYLDYAQHVAGKSMLNTPPSFAVYVTGLVCRWLQEEMGGLEQIQKTNAAKAKLLYDQIDQSDEFYVGHANLNCRSHMNVCFNLRSDDLVKNFLGLAAENGMTSLAGHRSVGGIRASIYNAMPATGVQSLAQFMHDFAQKNG